MSETKKRVMVAGLLVVCLVTLAGESGWWRYWIGIETRLSSMIVVACAWCCAVWLLGCPSGRIANPRRLLVAAMICMAIAIGAAVGSVFFATVMGRGGIDSLRSDLAKTQSELDQTKWEARQLAVYARSLQEVEKERDLLLSLKKRLQSSILDNYTYAINQSKDKAVEVKMVELLNMIDEHDTGKQQKRLGSTDSVPK